MPIVASPLEALAAFGFILAGLPMYFMTRQVAREFAPSTRLLDWILTVTTPTGMAQAESTLTSLSDRFAAFFNFGRHRTAPGSGYHQTAMEEEMTERPSVTT